MRLPLPGQLFLELLSPWVIGETGLFRVETSGTPVAVFLGYTSQLSHLLSVVSSVLHGYFSFNMYRAPLTTWVMSFRCSSVISEQLILLYGWPQNVC